MKLLMSTVEKAFTIIVPYSGGKDSVFQLWYIVKKLKLSCLLFVIITGDIVP